MQLFIIPHLAPSLQTIELTGAEAKHCATVLRMSVGDPIALTNGQGLLYTGTLTTCSPKSCTIALQQPNLHYQKMPFELHLAVAPTKNIDRIEWLLEKTTEIGLTSFVPLLCRRSERKQIRTDRLQAIAESAVKQSLKAYIPHIHPLQTFQAFLQQNDSFQGQKFIAHCHTPAPHHLKTQYTPPTNALIAIGPEGDFTPDEVQLALQHGFQPISLGTARLRTETAALFACAAIHLAQNNM